jgi:hypothetical protein
MNVHKTLWQVFRWPTVIGVASLAGLLSALRCRQSRWIAQRVDR